MSFAEYFNKTSVLNVFISFSLLYINLIFIS
ncbi:putative membrane protein, partial [Clostridioides difficile DA00216]